MVFKAWIYAQKGFFFKQANKQKNLFHDLFHIIFLLKIDSHTTHFSKKLYSNKILK